MNILVKLQMPIHPPPIDLNRQAILYEGKLIGTLREQPRRVLPADRIGGLVNGMVVEVQSGGLTESGIVVVDEKGVWIELC